MGRCSKNIAQCILQPGGKKTYVWVLRKHSGVFVFKGGAKTLQNADQVFPPYFPACTSEALEKKGQMVPLFSGSEQRALCFLDLA